MGYSREICGFSDPCAWDPCCYSRRHAWAVGMVATETSGRHAGRFCSAHCCGDLYFYVLGEYRDFERVAVGV